MTKITLTKLTKEEKRQAMKIAKKNSSRGHEFDVDEVMDMARYYKWKGLSGKKQ